jgi:hypothetical protein
MSYRINLAGRYKTRCHADGDDYCDWKSCPQLRDGEPAKSGRHCPIDAKDRRAEEEEQ